MSTPAGTAILGAGIFAKEAHLPALKALQTAGASTAVPLLAVYSRSQTSAASLAAEAASVLGSTPDVYYDGGSSTLDALLTRPDIGSVIVVLPITQQPSIILRALAAGKHVISEKPIAADVASGLKLIAEYEATYKPKGLVWRVAENWEVEPGFIAAGQAIRDGKIGKVTFFKASVCNFMDRDSKWYKTPWRTVPEYQGGFLLDGGVHNAASLRVMLPSPLTHLTGFASLNREWLAPHDTINAVLRTADGAHGLLDLSFASPVPSRSATNGPMAVITGSKGFLTLTRPPREQAGGKSVFRVTIKSVQDEASEGKGEEVEEIIDGEESGVTVELEGFFERIRPNGSDNGKGEPREALKDVALIQAGLTSNGSLVDLTKLVAQG
ncbi:NAD(P)-binding protein [Coniophora puteana RWD-64-598 SS2]|uniref:NAD(P)-binding protein n=1 Tax=Coniophora puteana (strain RWD-64-598) TaxID=741705 RepID=A0A5M3MK79_CONPW|nr:NAD(P)-binding protein [Coniophora puteana RWD-64-598 SS2]EIW79473.1 NAD(P)-binding protein [Coniophora puteana RWD-64-598 SS2]